MNFSFYIAKRYLKSKSSTNAINIITLIAMFGVIVGTIALFIILSGFSGLRTFSYSLLNASDPDIKISPITGKTFNYDQKIDEELISNTNIVSFSKVVEERVFLKYKDKSHIAHIKGVDNNYTEIVALDSSLVIGEWVDPEFRNTAVIGSGISYKLSLRIFNMTDPLKIFVPKPGKGMLNAANAFRSANVQIIGVYSGSEEFQNKYVFTELEVAQQLLNYEPNQVSAVEIKLRNADKVDDEAAILQQNLGDSFKVQTRAELNALIYKVINTENFVSYLIFTLIVIIALFNVIGAIIMMIIDKRKNLKTLINLGATLKDIKRVFVLQGFLLCLFGLVIGLFLAVILVLIQQQFGVFMITQNIPYPVEFQWSNFFIVILTITILGFIAAKIASSRITIDFVSK
ncbi:ABC transporter permease [Tenacibaculum sp. SZ-18]|uniref:ABC transporter permease n=1 Tax=Tenacibaculum sp. SZ-18 TaxID=754423 RepID=UPI000C2D4C6B|nr:FtsX-like permease family protein [Tenacibaculum sp. SZ-18]AUC13725.1 ABC transporter permease [Tenacibaculum sp. SZ-18]